MMQQMAKPSQVDLAVIQAQLGRCTEGAIVGVAARCSHGQPQVIATHPVILEGERCGTARIHGAAGAPKRLRPFPTLYWLTCPHLREAVAPLENAGMINRMREAIQSDDGLRHAHRAANHRYAAQRVALLEASEHDELAREAPWALAVIRTSGVGGLARVDGVKCLHMHLAHYMAECAQGMEAEDANPVGRMAAEELRSAGIDPECACGRCAPIRIAAINAGSNSAKVLVADVVQAKGRNGTLLEAPLPRVLRVTSAARVTGLGQGLGVTGTLSAEGRKATVEALREFTQAARDLGTERMWATATAAARVAVDVDVLVREVREECGTALEVISPDLEAELAFTGVLAVPWDGRRAWDPRRVVVVDSGGMSTQFMRAKHINARAAGICGSRECASRGIGYGAIQSISIPLGAVSLTDSHLRSDPPTSEEIAAMRAGIREALCDAEGVLGALPSRKDGPEMLVMVGGSAATLATIRLGADSFEADQVHGCRLTRDEVEQLFAELCAMPLADRQQVRGMVHSARARVMLGGTAIILGVMNLVGVNEMTVSVAGILDGMAVQIAYGGAGQISDWGACSPCR
ncbi:MAG: DUF501 domain-containing protein [Clostridia bacterium]|nr:DUF501 domain-containing protein [Clostridia bacterium]